MPDLHTVRFSEAMTYTGANPAGGGPVEGVRFTKNNVDALSVVHNTNMGTPNALIGYDVEWATPIRYDDTIRFIYSRSQGKYEDATQAELASQNVAVTNCAPALSPITTIGGWTDEPNCTPSAQPATPVIDEIIAGNQQLTINYSHPGPYSYAEFFDNGISMNAFDNDADRTITIVNLNNDQTYDVTMRVYSHNDFIASDPSNMVQGTPVAGAIPAPTWIDFSLPTVAQGQGWSIDLNNYVNAGGAATTFAVVGGNLPAGISLNTSTGTFTGTATGTGDDAVEFSVTTSGGSANSGSKAWSVIAAGGTLPAIYTRFMGLDAGPQSQNAVNASDQDNYDWSGAGANPAWCTYDNTRSFAGSPYSARLFVSGGASEKQLGGRVGFADSGHPPAAKGPWGKGTEIWYQFRTWFDQSYFDAGGLDINKACKGPRFNITSGDLNTWYLKNQCCIPGASDTYFWCQGDPGPIASATSFGVACAANGGTIPVANSWETFEIYMLITELNGGGILRLWRNHHPCELYPIIGWSGSQYVIGPAVYAGDFAAIRSAGDSLTGSIHNLGGDWKEPLVDVTVWSDAHVLCVNQTPAKRDANGFAFIGDWEND